MLDVARVLERQVVAVGVVVVSASRFAHRAEGYLFSPSAAIGLHCPPRRLAVVLLSRSGATTSPLVASPHAPTICSGAGCHRERGGALAEHPGGIHQHPDDIASRSKTAGAKRPRRMPRCVCRCASAAVHRHRTLARATRLAVSLATGHSDTCDAAGPPDALARRFMRPVDRKEERPNVQRRALRKPEKAVCPGYHPGYETVQRFLYPKSVGYLSQVVGAVPVPVATVVSYAPADGRGLAERDPGGRILRTPSDDSLAPQRIKRATLERRKRMNRRAA